MTYVHNGKISPKTKVSLSYFLLAVSERDDVSYCWGMIAVYYRINLRRAGFLHECETCYLMLDVFIEPNDDHEQWKI